LTGSSLLTQAIAEYPQHLANTGPVSQHHARDVAEAAFRANARRFVTGRGIAKTHPDLHVGTTLNLSGLGGLFDGEYYMVGLQHCFNHNTGFDTEFSVERTDLAGLNLERPRHAAPQSKPQPKPNATSQSDKKPVPKKPIDSIRRKA